MLQEFLQALDKLPDARRKEVCVDMIRAAVRRLRPESQYSTWAGRLQASWIDLGPAIHQTLIYQVVDALGLDLTIESRVVDEQDLKEVQYRCSIKPKQRATELINPRDPAHHPHQEPG